MHRVVLLRREGGGTIGGVARGYAVERAYAQVAEYGEEMPVGIVGGASATGRATRPCLTVSMGVSAL